MAEANLHHVEQPDPVGNDNTHVHDLVAADIAARKKLGISRYGQPLQAFNGRDPLRDAYEEVLDLACYLRQWMEERARQTQIETDADAMGLLSQAIANSKQLRLKRHMATTHDLGDAVVEEMTSGQLIQAHLDDHRTNGLAHQYQPWGDG